MGLTDFNLSIFLLTNLVFLQQKNLHDQSEIQSKKGAY